MAIALGANAGCAVLASRFFGSKNNAKIKSTVSTALIAFASLSALLMIAGVLSCRAVLTAMQTPAEALDDSVTYMNIYYYGLPFLILYNLGTGIFSALGDSRTPFLFLVFSSVSNIVLDYLMVRPWGVAGVARATFIAQGAACVLTLIFVLRRATRLHTEESDQTRVFSGTLLKMLVLLAIPVALQNSFVSVGNLIIQVKINELANAQGIGITNGFTAGFKLLVFSTTCFCTCANGLTNFVSQNFGAHKFRRIRRGFYAALIISTLLTAVFAFSTFFFAEPLVLLFMPGRILFCADDDGAVRSDSAISHIFPPLFYRRRSVRTPRSDTAYRSDRKQNARDPNRHFFVRSIPLFGRTRGSLSPDREFIQLALGDAPVSGGSFERVLFAHALRDIMRDVVALGQKIERVFFLLCALYEQHIFPPLFARKPLGEGKIFDALVHFRDLAHGARLSAAECPVKERYIRIDVLRRGVKDERAAKIGVFAQERALFRRLSAQKAQKRELIRRESRKDERRHKGARAGNEGIRHAAFAQDVDEQVAGVGHDGRARVGDDGNVFPLGGKVGKIAVAVGVARYARMLSYATAGGAALIKVILLILAAFGISTLWFSIFIDAIAAVAASLVSILAFSGELYK